MSEEPKEDERSTKAELRAIVQELMAALHPATAKYPGLEVVLSIAVRRPAAPHRLAHCLATTLDPTLAIEVLAEGAKDLALLLRKVQS